MPFKKRYGRKPRFNKYRRKFRRRPFRKAQNRVSGPLRPAVHRFKRMKVEQVVLDASAPSTGWIGDGLTGLMNQQIVKLADLNDSSDFVNLFTSYRIKGVRLQGWLSNTQSEGSSNNNVMLYYNQNWQGVSEATTLTEQYFLDRPASVHKSLQNHTNNRPSFDIYVKLRQLANVWSGSHVTNDYGTIKPKWISTLEPSCPHFGLNLRLARINGTSFGLAANDFQTIKIIKTYYIECLGIS